MQDLAPSPTGATRLGLPTSRHGELALPVLSLVSKGPAGLVPWGPWELSGWENLPPPGIPNTPPVRPGPGLAGLASLFCRFPALPAAGGMLSAERLRGRGARGHGDRRAEAARQQLVSSPGRRCVSFYLQEAFKEF